MIIFFGPPASGKSLQAEKLAKEFNWRWFSIGKALRESNDEEVNEIMKTGKLVGHDLTYRIVDKYLDNLNENENVIFDGFPRSEEQSIWLYENQDKSNNRKIKLIIVLDVAKEELQKRMNLRGRPDDTGNAFIERMKIYNNETDPMINFFEKNGVDISHIDGNGSPEQVYDLIKKELTKCKIL